MVTCNRIKQFTAQNVLGIRQYGMAHGLAMIKTGKDRISKSWAVNYKSKEGDLMYQWQYFDIGRCCICGQPLSTSSRGNWVPLMKKAAWKMPAWNNPVHTMPSDGAVANFCDGCREAKEKSGIFGYIKYAVEYRDEQVIYHEVEKLEDLIVNPGHDQEKRG